MTIAPDIGQCTSSMLSTWSGPPPTPEQLKGAISMGAEMYLERLSNTGLWFFPPINLTRLASPEFKGTGGRSLESFVGEPVHVDVMFPRDTVLEPLSSQWHAFGGSPEKGYFQIQLHTQAGFGRPTSDPSAFQKLDQAIGRWIARRRTLEVGYRPQEKLAFMGPIVGYGLLVVDDQRVLECWEVEPRAISLGSRDVLVYLDHTHPFGATYSGEVPSSDLPGNR
ncbi:MAG: hypothetical protein GWP91_01905 [Rhodobacterales bacterium]|jgi:hypothetical protein|nr:hypothetical protein [Rhodobacterales bacterium]